MATGIKEIHFEEHIEKYLVEQDNYNSISTSEYDKNLCLIPNEVIDFVKDTQPKQYKALKEQYGSSVDNQIVNNLAKNIKKNKTPTNIKWKLIPEEK